MQNDQSRSDGFAPQTRTEFFDSQYLGSPPWDIGKPQPAFLALAGSAVIAGKVLDVGCGTGEHVFMAAERGHDAAGIDSSPRAIELAGRKAAERGLDARFFVRDVLELASLREHFDTVLDCGLYHSLQEGELPRFIDGLRRTIPAGGKYVMLCFSDLQPGEFGPRRIPKAEIENNFSEGWRVDSIDPAEIEVRAEYKDDGRAPNGVAWLVIVSRV